MNQTLKQCKWVTKIMAKFNTEKYNIVIQSRGHSSKWLYTWANNNNKTRKRGVFFSAKEA